VGLPPSKVPQPIVDRDSTRVLALTGTKSFGVVFSRNPDGTRPKSITVTSEAIAQRIAAEHKAHKIVAAFVAWLANLMPRQAPHAAKILGVGMSASGVRRKPWKAER
jgi:hypothetical protein